MLNFVETIIERISMNLFGQTFNVRAEKDNKGGDRIFVQITYESPCNKTGEVKEWHGRKWYLSEHMTEDEIIKTCFAAFKATVEHETMEAFKVDDIILFNPHINYEELLKISNKEIKR